MQAPFGLVLVLVGIALLWVALHGYESAQPGFRGVLEGLYGGIRAANQ